jgi:hypothetical protein
MARSQLSNAGEDNDSTTSAYDYEHEKVPIVSPSYATFENHALDDQPPPLLRRSTRQRTPTSRNAYCAHSAITKNISEFPDNLQLYMHQTYQAEIENSLGYIRY